MCSFSQACVRAASAVIGGRHYARHVTAPSPTQIATWAETVNRIAPWVQPGSRNAAYFLAETISSVGTGASDAQVLSWASELYQLLAAATPPQWLTGDVAGRDMVTTAGGDNGTIALTAAFITAGLTPAKARGIALAVINVVGGGGDGDSAALPIADPVNGSVDSTRYVNHILGSGHLSAAVFDGLTSAFALAMEGDSSPRLLVRSDGTIYLGNGVLDPRNCATLIWDEDTATVTIGNGQGSDYLRIGASDTNHQSYAEFGTGLKFRAGTEGAGITFQGGPFDPNGAAGGSFGDLFFRTDVGINNSDFVIYRCTTAGEYPDAVWTRLQTLPRQGEVELGSPTDNDITTALIPYSGQRLFVANSSPNTLTIRSGIGAGGGNGVWFDIEQRTAGQITVAGDSGVFLHSRGGRVHSAGQNALFRIRNRGGDDWLLDGDLV